TRHVRGVALYNSRRDLLQLADSLEKDPRVEDVVGRVPGTALLYTPTRVFGERRLEEVYRHEWKLASRNAYPVVVGTGPGRESHWPTPAEIRILTAALRVLPPFLRRVVRNRELLEQGGILAETREVYVSGRTLEVDILFPFPLRGA
ncbi:MAG: hypothetical protein QHJ73_11455, partial [Armatimonadota bacterium]|nr:hypothetical protein [Armatimonadota bacterium]